ncbi:MAG: hypothetical protein PUA87_09185, partial [Oscillospiraceae bacterium]|nr:hypothetical protein [Oscillospiraceae bacterium]
MKKWLTIPLAMSLLVSLAACGEATPSASVAESAPTETQAPSPEPGAPVEEASTPEAAPIPEDSQVEDSTPEVVREGPTIQSVTYGANYVETAATDDDTINSPFAFSNVSDYHKIGAQYNVANQQINNPVNVSVLGGSIWNVVLADGTCGEADACYIGSLTVDADSTLTASEPVTIHVYGAQDIKGTVDQNITIVQ